MGYLKGGIAAWQKSGLETDQVESINPYLLESMKVQKVSILDVRNTSEFQSEHVSDAENIPLNVLNENLSHLRKEETFYIHCAGGYRSMIAASILKSRGYHNIIDVSGGFDAIKKTNVPVTNFVCPSTL